MKKQFDFSGWATKNDMRCSDGRTIRHGAFKHCDGLEVPLVWNHSHKGPEDVLGHALLENRDDGVYCYCSFNDTKNADISKTLVKHGDIKSLSIFANKLKQIAQDVVHGQIIEVSLVHAGANPGAYIDTIIAHSEENDEEAIIYTGEPLSLCHSDGDTSAEEPKVEKEKKDSKESKKTIAQVFDTMNEEQQDAAFAMVGMALEEAKGTLNDVTNNKSEGGNEMKHNAFDNETTTQDGVLSHSQQAEIISIAKNKSVGSLQNAIAIYAEENDSLSHGIDGIGTLFPEFKDVRPGAPELIQRDQGWVSVVMQKTHKSPISRIRTRQADVRSMDLRGSGHKKGDKKNVAGNIKLVNRTTDPQTVYRKDALHRDDIIDITDFDVVEYQYDIMRQNLNEEIATAIMIGDGREDGDEAKIDETHIRPIWKDDELYTIHTDVDIEAARAELQGSGTDANFGDDYVYAEAIIRSALFSREKYKGSGTPDFYCTPHLLNVMLLARDRNGRRIYDSKSDLAAALNVKDIYTVEQFEGQTRTTKDGAEKKLLGIFVNLTDYHVGSTKGGEITRFNQFDIDFNQEKYLIETRLSGALTRVYSAIALEEPATTEAAG